ncbi:GNAT family protein [Brevibacillus choshinensis]|uniref:GNAT family N-acetyltransferase n=1 Tax=Brevibacillus choshinensis TaxID=54911 RepID=UPI002E247C63|nr:GNAT family protein [Brevibacillus choshinensis]MED4753893.1 GNAT family protein [Brevibacillus choshinensis]
MWDIGLGMKPELTGQGFGQAFLKWGIDFALQHYSPSQLRLSVAAFNQRAIRQYSKVGFREVGSFQNKDVLFLVMTMEV